MKLIVPNYYENFKCIADQCRHNCCIGWEIDIDEETYDLYSTIPGKFGERLKNGISPEGTPHFILDERARCPFLNQQNLCDIIMALGEDALCGICADHPRFRNYLSDRTEMGLGLCCEAAGQLILGQQEKTTLITLADDGADEPEDFIFLRMREQIFTILQDRRNPVEQRLAKMLAFCKSKIPLQNWVKIYKELERLDPTWDPYLEKIASPLPLGPEWEIPLEQLAVYFAYRHLAGALEDGRTAERVAFIALSVKIISSIAANEPDLTLEKFTEIARLYSSEIEYSDENIEILLKKLTEQC